ncbi:phage tail tape measure protein [Methylobacterium sp. A49B]
MGRIIEAKAVISGEDRLSKVLDGLQKKFKEVGKGAKVSTEVARLGKEIDGAAKGMRDLERLRGAQGSFAQARTAFRSTQADVSRIAKELDAARKAATAFDGIRSFSKSGGIAQEMANARRNVADLERQFSTAQRAVKAASSAYESQASALKGVRTELTGSGSSVGKLVAEQHRLKAAIEGANAAILRQEAVAQAEGRLTAGMGAAGSRTAARIAQSRRVTEGMGVAGRAHREQQEQAANEKLEALEARRTAVREARSTMLGGAGVYLGHKIHEGTDATLHTYKEFDFLSRKQQAVADLTDDELKSRQLQGRHLGGTTQFNDLQVMHAQLDLAQRGVKKEFVEPFINEIVNYAQAMGSTLPDAAKTMEGIVFSTNQDVEDPASALKTMRKNVDQAVKLAKIGGLDNEDVKEAFKFGGPSGSGAGLHNETMGAIFALLRRSGFAGSEAGVATRAAASKLVSPTNKGLGALAAMGLNYNDYVTMPLGNRPEIVEGAFKQKFGKGFTAAQKQRMDDLINNPDIFGDQQKFIEGATDIAGSSFEKNKKGKMKVTDQKALAKVFGGLWSNMIESVDTERLFHDFLNSNPTLSQANAFFTDKHGGKIMALARKAALFDEYVEKLKHTPEGFAGDIGRKINAGYYGASTRVVGTRLNMESSVGQAIDPFITRFDTMKADFQQAIAELPKSVLAAGAAAGWIGGKAATIAGGAVLTGTATGLTYGALSGGASAATVASLAIGTLTVGTIAAAALAVTAPLVFAADNDKALVHGGKPDIAMKPGDVLPGLDGLAKADRTPSLPPGAAQPGSRAAEGVASLIDAPRANTASSIDAATAALARYRQQLEALKSEADGLSDLGLPGIGGGDPARKAELEGQIRTAEERLRALRPPTDPTPAPGSGLPATTVPLPPARPAELGGDPGGLAATLRNTLEQVVSAATTAANGGKPIEAKVMPDQITAKVPELPPVSGEATITLNPQRVIVELNSDMLTAKIAGAVASQTAKMPLTSSGARPGAVSMPGAASTPGAVQ